MYLSMVCGMLVCVSLSIKVCIFNVSNALRYCVWVGWVVLGETCCDSVVDVV